MNYELPKISQETVELFAYTNKKELNRHARAIVLDFHGLGGQEMKNKASDFDKLLAENGILCVYPYYGPWSWMNRDSVKYVDELVEAICKREELDINTVPIISVGGSMGGLSALIYSKYARVTPKACFANCPVCDLLYHATERPDLPRSIYLAFNYGEETLYDAIKNNSPLHQAENMPDIPYYIIHGTSDKAVNKEMHSDRFVEAMKKAGKNVKYVVVENMEHCYLTPFPKVMKAYYDAIIKACD